METWYFRLLHGFAKVPCAHPALVYCVIEVYSTSSILLYPIIKKMEAARLRFVCFDAKSRNVQFGPCLVRETAAECRQGDLRMTEPSTQSNDTPPHSWEQMDASASLA